MGRRRGHNEGSIAEIKDKNGKVIAYRPQISLPGGTRRSLPRVKTKKEALKSLQQAQVALMQGKLGPHRSQTLADYLRGWLATVGPSVRPSTYSAYDLNVRRILPEIGRVRLDTLKPAHVQELYNSLYKRGLSPRTVRQVHMILHKALEDAMKLDLVVRNATDGTTLPRVPSEEMSWFTAEELDRLFQSTVGDRFHALWVLLGTAGLRLGEALGLKWEDIDLERRTLTVQRALQRQRAGGGLVFVEPKSARSRRTIELSEEARAALKAHQERQAFERKAANVLWQEQGLLFPSEIGTALEQGRVHHHWTKAVDKAGVPRHRIHDLRHTVATLLMTAGMNALEVAEILGHSNANLVHEVYGHVAPSSRRRAADLMDAVLKRERDAM